MGKRMRPHTLQCRNRFCRLQEKLSCKNSLKILRVFAMNNLKKLHSSSDQHSDLSWGDVRGCCESQCGSIWYQEEALELSRHYVRERMSRRKSCCCICRYFVQGDFKMDTSQRIIWVQIEDPRVWRGGERTRSDHRFRWEASNIREWSCDYRNLLFPWWRESSQVQYLLDNNIRDKGEFQLTNALENMKSKGLKFTWKSYRVARCGNKDATVYTSQRVLEFVQGDKSWDRLRENWEQHDYWTLLHW